MQAAAPLAALGQVSAAGQQHFAGAGNVAAGNVGSGNPVKLAALGSHWDESQQASAASGLSPMEPMYVSMVDGGFKKNMWETIRAIVLGFMVFSAGVSLVEEKATRLAHLMVRSLDLRHLKYHLTYCCR